MRSRRGASARLLLIAVACALVAFAVWSRGAPTGLRPGSTVLPELSTALRTRSADRPRPLVFANRQTVHVGKRAIDTHLDILSVVAAEGGAAFTTFDGQLWFTDGRTVLPIGVSTRARVTPTGVDWGAAGRPNERIVADDIGPDIAWMEYGRHGLEATKMTIAVFNTRSVDGVLRLPFTTPGNDCRVCVHIVLVRHGFVYLSYTRARDLGVRTQSDKNSNLFRVDLATGRQTLIPVAAYRTELLNSARTLVIGDEGQVGLVESGVGEDFAFVNRQLVLHAVGPGDAAFGARTQRRPTLRLPPSVGGSLGPTDRFYLFEWLDNDRFALLDTSETRSRGLIQGDIVVCRLSTSRCAVAVHRPVVRRWQVVPGIDLDGSDRAESVAIRRLTPSE